MGRWIKQGVLPVALNPEWSTSHAALPTIDLTDPDAPDLYLSTRDAEGRSRIGRARLDLGHSSPRVTDADPEPALGLGQLGCFDDRGVTSSQVVRHEGLTYLYYSGWSLGRTVPFYFYVGLAVSEGGASRFRRVSEAPILDRSAVDPYLTASPAILIESGTWRMWYVSGTGWERRGGGLRHRYHIKYAESSDGIAWRRDGTVCIDYSGPDEYAISRPCVVKDGSTYRMWFAARGETYRLGYAESDDGVRWRRDDPSAGLEVSDSGWDAEMVAYPMVFDHAGTRYMLYNGNGYGQTGVGLATFV